MKLHAIFSKEFSLWWVVMAVLSVVKFSIWGLPVMDGEKYGIIYYTLSVMFTGLILGSVLYLLYRLISGKWNNKVFIILITLTWFIFLVARFNAPKTVAANFRNDVEFKDFSSVDLTINENNYYHSSVNNYRIQVPSGWMLTKGQALGIELNMVSPDKGAIFSLQVATFKNKAISVDDIPDNFFLKLLESDRVSDMNIRFSDMTNIANQKTKHISMSFSYSQLNEKLDYLVDFYTFVYDKKEFNLICKSKTELGQIFINDFKAILNSFMLEKYY